MIEDTTESTPSQDSAPIVDRQEDHVRWATWVGLILALVGLVDGVIMALKRRVATCPDGKFFPEGTTDFDCYVHPQAGVGIGIAVTSVLLGIVVVFSGIVARASLRSSPVTNRS